MDLDDRMDVAPHLGVEAGEKVECCLCGGFAN